MGPNKHALPKRPAASPGVFPKLGVTPSTTKKSKPWAGSPPKSSPGIPGSGTGSSKADAREALDFPALGIPTKPTITHASLVADDGTTFILPAQALAKASEVFKDALLIPTPSPTDESSVPTFPITDVSTAAVAYLAGILTCQDAYHDPPSLPLDCTDIDTLLTDIIEVQDKYEINAQIVFQAVIRRLELDYGHSKSQTIFVFAALGKFVTVVARYSTFLLSPVHQYQYIWQPEGFWWTRTLKAKNPERFDEVGSMYQRWESEYIEFVESCTPNDFKFSDECKSLPSPCPTYMAECGVEESYYLHAAMRIWETIEAYPQCVCVEVLLVALETKYPDSFCKTCATTMIDAILRQYDWHISPASWRMGSLNRDMADMLFDYMSWTLSGKKKVVTSQ